MHKKFCRHFGLRPYFKCPTTSIKGHGGGKKGKALVNDEGHGAIALDLLAHINRVGGSVIFGRFWDIWGAFWGDIYLMGKAMGPLPLIFLPISIGGSVIFWAFFWHFFGKLVNGEGHGAIVLDFLARINSW